MKIVIDTEKPEDINLVKEVIRSIESKHIKIKTQNVKKNSITNSSGQYVSFCGAPMYTICDSSSKDTVLYPNYNGSAMYEDKR